MCLTYILYSETRDRYYIGHTCDDIHERLRKHNSSHSGFTGSENDWKVVFTQQFDSKTLAYARERQIKGWKSRKLVQALIEGS
jgi:putative endonuclease